ncbi:hypothetical protein [Parafilimonas sp.]
MHPGIIELYEKSELEKYLDALDEMEQPQNKPGLTKDEKVLMKLLSALVS